MVFFQLFSNSPEIHKVSAGKTLFAQGDASPCMYVLVSGSAEVVAGSQIPVAIAAGDVVGEASLVSSAPRAQTVIAKTDCLFVEVDEERFHFLVRETPTFATRVMRIMAERLAPAASLIPEMECA
ncbi:MAG: Crp/Fnr family transcriptional regulator [Actinomycetota bacterium]